MEDRHEQNATLADYIRILWSHRWMISLVTLSVFGFTLFFTLRMDPVYEAETTILIEPQDSGAVSLFDPTGFMKQKTLVNNECELLKSRTLALHVIDRAMAAGWAPVVEPDTEPLTREQLANSLRARLSVHPLKDADIINIGMRASSPAEAAQFANLVAEEYRSQNISQNRGELTEVRRFLEDQLNAVQNRLSSSEEDLRVFKQESGVVSLSSEVEQLVKQLAEFEAARNGASTEHEALQRRLSYLEEELEASRVGLVDDIERAMNSLVADLREQVVKLQTERSSLIVRGAPEDGPQIRALDSKVGEATEKLRSETRKIVNGGLLPGDPLVYNQELVDRILALKAEVETAASRAEALDRIVQDYSARLGSLPDKELALARRQRDYTVNETTYLMMKNKYEEIRISEAGEIGNVRVIDPALSPLDPIHPNKRLNAILGLVLGLGLGIGMAFLLEYLDTSLRSIEEVERKLDTSVLGAVPTFQESDRSLGRRRSLVTALSPRSPVAESFRTVRTNLGFVAAGDAVGAFGVTSSGPKEGKSTTASNLAITMAEAGQRTLLVDADLRRPMLHEIFSLESANGLTDHLAGTLSLDEALRETDVENLSVIPSGTLPPNPSELLGSNAMKAFLEEARGRFDRIVFDTPPVMPVTDALVLSTLLDGVLMVVESGRTAESVARRTRTLLGNGGVRFLGVVLNNVRAGAGYGYGKYGYYAYQGELDAPQSSKGRRVAAAIAFAVLTAAGAALWWGASNAEEGIVLDDAPKTDGRVAGVESLSSHR